MDFSLITDEPLDYCVYAHVNKQNGKMYIGITNNVKRRWIGKGSEYDKCTEFYNAIKEYGWENFDHIILIDKISKQMASIFECELIKKYKLVENGYNLSKGSWNVCGTITAQPIYQYDLEGNFIKKWNSVSEANQYFGATANVAVGIYKDSYYGYQWSYDYVEKMSPYDVEHNHLYTPIYQYDLDGNFVKEWSKQKDAMEKYGFSIRICAYGQSRTAYNYRWSLEKLDKLPPLPPIEYSKTHKRTKPLKEKDRNVTYKNSKKVYRFGIDGNLIKIYDNIYSIKDVDVTYGQIYSLCIKKNCFVYRDSIWVYEEDAYTGYVQDVIDRHKKLHPKVIQYDTNGNYIATFNNITSVSEEGYTWENVSKVCNKQRVLANGYQWRYEWDLPPGKLDNYRRRIVRQVVQKTLDGEIIAIYPNAKEAGVTLGNPNKSVNILNVCKGKLKSAYGYLWEFQNNQEVN